MQGVNTSNHELFIIETEPPFSALAIQFVPPKMGGSRDAKLQSVAIVGRNNDILHYTGGNDTLNLELELYSQSENVTDVYDRINWLKSLTANDGYAGKYRNVLLVFGDLFKHHVWAIKSVKDDMSHFSQANAWMPLRGKVSLQLQLDPEKNRYIQDIRDGR